MSLSNRKTTKFRREKEDHDENAESETQNFCKMQNLHQKMKNMLLTRAGQPFPTRTKLDRRHCLCVTSQCKFQNIIRLLQIINKPISINKIPSLHKSVGIIYLAKLRKSVTSSYINSTKRNALNCTN